MLYLSLTFPGETENLWQIWENDFAVNISSEDWDSVWDHAKRISLCNRVYVIQFKIICWLHISPYIRKIFAAQNAKYQLVIIFLRSGLSQNSVVLEENWQYSGYEYRCWSLFIYSRSAGWLYFEYVIISMSFSMLTFRARKDILMFWINEKTPSIKKWHNLEK